MAGAEANYRESHDLAGLGSVAKAFCGCLIVVGRSNKFQHDRRTWRRMNGCLITPRLSSAILVFTLCSKRVGIPTKLRESSYFRGAGGMWWRGMRHFVVSHVKILMFSASWLSASRGRTNNKGYYAESGWDLSISCFLELAWRSLGPQSRRKGGGERQMQENERTNLFCFVICPINPVKQNIREWMEQNRGERTRREAAQRQPPFLS